MCQHEYARPRNDNIMSDIYDSPAWQEFMGPPTSPINRIGLQVCADAIPAFASNTLSLKPVILKNFSLPPSVRGRVENMLLLMLFPAKMKEGQKKYFDFAANYEINHMDSFGNTYSLLFTSDNNNTHTYPHSAGIDGMYVRIFTTSCDTPGRSEMNGNVCVMTDSCRTIMFYTYYHVVFCFRYAVVHLIPRMLSNLHSLVDAWMSGHQVHIRWISEVSDPSIARSPKTISL